MKLNIVINKLRKIAISQVNDSEEAAEEMSRANSIKSINDFLSWAKDSSWDLPEAVGIVFHEMGIEIEDDILSPNE